MLQELRRNCKSRLNYYQYFSLGLCQINVPSANITLPSEIYSISESVIGGSTQ